MKDSDLNNLLECAVEAVKTAGEYALANYSRKEEVFKDEDDDIKLMLDIECQEKIFEVIKSSFPSHEILGEEGSAAETGSGYRWIVDPIDGTINFSHGLPLWCSSVAVQLDGKTQAGAVYSPMLNQCYTATATGEALCNGREIHVSATTKLEDAMVLSGFPKTMKHSRSSRDLFKKLMANTQRTRIYGAAALDLCFVASGGADAYMERGIYIWDVAAAQLIIERAGGITKVFEEMEDGKFGFMAGNESVFNQLLNLL